MKVTLCLSLVCAATVQAQSSSVWTAFDSGGGTSQSPTMTHRGVFTGWPPRTLQSSTYTLLSGSPVLPIPVATPGAPSLTISRVGSDLRISWPASGGFVLEFTDSLGGSASWSNVPGPYQSDGLEEFLLVPAAEARRFYRLAPGQTELTEP